jgi:hypothetical protein
VGLEFFAIAAPIGWLSAWVVSSIIYRRKSGKPIFPRAPDTAVFAEAWCSGRSLQNLLTRIGGARNCLLVYVADDTLTIVPIFPFNLMFLPEIYGLETTTLISNVRATCVEGLFGKRLLLTIEGLRERRFELSLRDQRGFRDVLEGKEVALIRPNHAKGSDRPRASWQLNLFRVFAIVWGVGAGAAGFTGLQKDIYFRSHGTIAIGSIVGHTGEIGAKSDIGVVQYEVAGRPYTLTSIRGSGIYKIGDREKIFYMPDDPPSAREEDYLGFDLLFACLGSCMLILAVTVGWIARVFTRSMNV